MSVVLTPEEVKKYEEERKLDQERKLAEEPSWKVEMAKMLSTLALNLVVIVVLVLATLNTTADLSTRFMSMLEIVIGAIFGVTATQIAKS